MGCFLACFGSEKRRKPAKKKLPRNLTHGNYEPPQPASSFKQPTKDEDEVLIPILSDKREEQSLSSRKKVTFDLNVNTYVKVSVDEVPNYSSESDDEKDGEKKGGEKTGNQSISPSRVGDFPSNHRYQNCINSDEEEEEDEDELEYEDSDFDDDEDDDDDNIVGVQEVEESFSSCFSLPIKEENNSKPICDSATSDWKPTILAKSNARDRSQYVDSVLNPVENLSQWKAVKARTTPLKHPKKENIEFDEELHMPISSEPSFKSPKPKKPFDSSLKQEIRVDTSLSNWLVSSEATQTPKTSITHTDSSEKSESIKSYSSRYNEDRPILGALTVEEIKQSLSSPSPRRSPSRSPDDIPIVGTVGSYWNHLNKPSDFKGIPNTTSKYKEDKRVNWHFTPFQVRLERALNQGVADAYSSYPPGV